MDNDTPGGSSRHPTPSRTLANPSRLTVAHRSTPNAQTDDTGDTDAETFKQSLIHRAKITKKGERWSDKLMEGAVDSGTFKKALLYLTPQQYRDVLHERHLANLCSYPPCANTSKAPYTSHKRYKISYTTRTIREKEGNEDEGFCSTQHRLRSEWIEKKLSEISLWDRAGREGIELLEELEAKMPDPQATPPSGSARDTTNTSNGSITHAPSRVSIANGSSNPQTLWKERIQAIAKDSPTSTQSSVTDLISNLTIHERPSARPASAPALNPETLLSDPVRSDFSAASASSPTTTPKASSLSTSTRRTNSSLVPTPSKLSSTVLSASRQMGAIPQLAPDTDSEVEEGDWGEGDMGLEWGEETPEMRALFEEARQAREMLEEAGEEQ